MVEVVLFPLELIDCVVVESDQEEDVGHEQVSDDHFANSWPLILKDSLDVFHVKDTDLI